MISPSPLLRQRPNHYAFRAGRNLPDKEFRYLRTVIVTAAVHWGFNSMLAHLLLTFQHRAGVSPYTSSFDLAETCVFDKQLLGPILCDSYLYESPLSLSYGVILPSSLTRVFSRVLVFSTYLPVSVCGTGTYIISPRSFSWKLDIIVFYASVLSLNSRICLQISLASLQPNPLKGNTLAFSVTPSVI